ncbi:MAG: hypothetical protein ACI37U_09505 [Bacteroides sp.]
MNDLTSSKRDLKDAQGKVCPAVSVQLSIDEGISFREAVKVESKTGGYTVFVPAYTKQLTVLRADTVLCQVLFPQWDIQQLEPNNTYRVELAIKLDLDKVFRVEPATAQVTVNGINVPLDKEGVGSFSCEVNRMYNYTISAPGYESFSDAFMIAPEDERVDPINVSLERQTVPVRFACNAKEFEVLLDNESWGLVSNDEAIELPAGDWELRIAADGYEAFTQSVHIEEGAAPIQVALKSSNEVSKKLRPRMSFYAGGGVGFPIEKRTEMNKDNVTAYPVRVGFDMDVFVSRFFTIRPGLEFMALLGDKMKRNDKTPYSVNVSLLANFNAPLGKFNRHHFSIGVGPIIGGGGLLDEEKNTTTSSEDEDSKLLYGGRAEARITINHFIFGMNIDYLRCDYTIGGKGMIAPMLHIGYKF